jgi:hypothetical protein
MYFASLFLNTFPGLLIILLAHRLLPRHLRPHPRRIPRHRRLHGANTGKIMNLASNHVERFLFAAMFINYLFWSGRMAFLGTGICGWLCFVGVWLRAISIILEQ